MTAEQTVQHIISEILPAMKINLTPGRHELSDGSYYNVDEYTPKPPEDCRFESHKHFIDIQYLISGEELIYTANISSLTPATEYDETHDVILYQDAANAQTVHLKAGEFHVFYPQDAHKASVRTGTTNSKVKKSYSKCVSILNPPVLTSKT